MVVCGCSVDVQIAISCFHLVTRGVVPVQFPVVAQCSSITAGYDSIGRQRRAQGGGGKGVITLVPSPPTPVSRRWEKGEWGCKPKMWIQIYEEKVLKSI